MIYVMTGSSQPFAVVSVTYPSGSNCTCTKGSKQLRAENTSGRWLFIIPEAGNWKIVCKDGSKTAEKTVNIGSTGALVQVTLAYEFYIFRQGVGFQNNFGVNNENLMGVSSTNEKISISGVNTSYSLTRMEVQPTINLAPYAAFVIEANVTREWPDAAGTNGSGVPYMLVAKKDQEFPHVRTSGSWGDYHIASTRLTVDKVKKTYSVDISAVNETAKIGVMGGMVAEIYNIYLK